MNDQRRGPDVFHFLRQFVVAGRRHADTVQLVETREGKELDSMPLLRERVARFLGEPLHGGVRAHEERVHARLLEEVRDGQRRVAR